MRKCIPFLLTLFLFSCSREAPPEINLSLDQSTEVRSTGLDDLYEPVANYSHEIWDINDELISSNVDLSNMTDEEIYEYVAQNIGVEQLELFGDQLQTIINLLLSDYTEEEIQDQIITITETLVIEYFENAGEGSLAAQIEGNSRMSDDLACYKAYQRKMVAAVAVGTACCYGSGGLGCALCAIAGLALVYDAVATYNQCMHDRYGG